MDGVEAVACDMNSDFEEAFENCCPHIHPVLDFFHIQKNFCDKVIGEVRKSGYVDRYEELINQNKLLFTTDIIKEKLSKAYKMTDEIKIAYEILEIMDI